MTATHWAAYNKDSAVVAELLRHGAPHFSFSHMGRLPIDVGGSSRAYAVIDTCLEHYWSVVKGTSISHDNAYATEGQRSIASETPLNRA